MRIDKIGCANRKKIAAFAVLAASAFMSFSANAATDIYGNEIKEVDGKTYQFWVSGTKAEVATFTNSSLVSSSSGPICSGTLSTPSQEAISLEARFRTWFKSLGTALNSTVFTGLSIFVR